MRYPTLKKSLKSTISLLGLEGQAKILFSGTSALHCTGWYLSARLRQSVDANCRPIPWFAYPAIDFIEERLRPHHIVFEYGAGASTLWFANHAREIISVEHDKDWHSRCQSTKPRNVTLLWRPLQSPSDYDTIAFGEPHHRTQYTDAVFSYDNLDVVSIDGIYRNACIAATESTVRPSTIIIADNSDLPGLKPGIDYLTCKGWKRLRFVGMCPIIERLSETSIFYRAENVWGI